MAKRTWRALSADHLFGHAAELGFYFFFAVFPALFCASSILGLAARSADQIYLTLLNYLALVVPKAVLGTVIHTFNQTTAASTPGKVTFGFLGAIWTASVGISAIQDTLNEVYKLRESRSYIKARLEAIGLTLILSVVVTFILASLFGGTFFADLAQLIPIPTLAKATAILARLAGWALATFLYTLCFALIYYWAPDFGSRHWHLFSPGSAVGILGWLIASLGLRVYLLYFNNFSVTYGSLGVVIILLTWFYITGLMILLGAEIDHEIEVAAAEMHAPISPPSSDEARRRMNVPQQRIERLG